jgi:hypothetical protein
MRIELNTWADLSRIERRALLQVFAGGSLRSFSEPTVKTLRAFNLVSNEHELTSRGFNMLQVVARSDFQRRRMAA